MKPATPRLAAQCIRLHDLIHLARGGDPKRMHVVSTSPGYVSPGLAYRSNGQKVEVTVGPGAPCSVTWTELGDYARGGLPDDLDTWIDEATAAYAAYCDAADPTRSPDDPCGRRVAYSEAVATMRAIEDAVHRDAAAARTTNLFGELV